MRRKKKKRREGKTRDTGYAEARKANKKQTLIQKEKKGEKKHDIKMGIGNSYI
jgi:hypothetical protein